jgi:hypothetical protein
MMAVLDGRVIRVPKEGIPHPGPGELLDIQAVPVEAADLIRRQHEMLKRLEWSSGVYFKGKKVGEECPMCRGQCDDDSPEYVRRFGAPLSGSGHAPTCALAALLKEVEGE